MTTQNVGKGIMTDADRVFHIIMLIIHRKKQQVAIILHIAVDTEIIRV